MRTGIRPQHSPQIPVPAREAGAAALALTAVVVAAAVCLLTACSATVSSGGHPSPPPATSRPGSTGHVTVPADGHLTWLLTRSALAQLVADPSVRAELQAAQVYEILQPGQQPLTGFAARSVVTFASAAALESAVNAAQIPPGTWGVLYDPEAWSLHPGGRAAGSGARRYPGRGRGSR